MARNVSRPAVKIATLGVALGVAVILISVAVVVGFKHTIRDKVVGFGSHITIANYMTLQTPRPEPIEIGDSMIKVLGNIEGVRAVQRYSITQGILKTDEEFLGVSFKGVAEEYDSAFIASNVIEGTMPKFSGEKSTNKILISKTIADKLHVHANDRVMAYFLTGGEDVRARKFTISGIYQTHLSKYDETTCFADLYTVGRLNGWEDGDVTGAELLIDDFNELDTVENRIIDNVNKTMDAQGRTFTSATVRELAPQLFSWLDLLDLNVWVILALMLSVAGITIISGLLIIIFERTSMIGVLKALGSRNTLIRHTFLWLAMFIVGKGVIIGNILGLSIIFLQKTFGIVKLDPTTYYVDTVPVEMPLLFWGLINVGVILVCALILVLPSFFVSNIHPARSMRYE